VTPTGRTEYGEPELQNIPVPIKRVLLEIERRHKEELRKMALALQVDYSLVERRIGEATNG
jgi:hypothetical protein